MTPEEIIDRERRRRENELALLLLLLLRDTRRYGDAALRVGSDPFAAMAAVLLGSQALNLPGGTARLAALLMLADRTGFRRTQLFVPGGVYRPIDYRGTASIALSQMWATLQRRVGLAFGVAQRGVQGLRQALRGAFNGYTAANPYRVRTVAETLVGTAYGSGYYAGWQRPEAREVVRGFRYSSVLDEATTPICRAYGGTQLPTDHPWWLSHWPLNHWGCRAVVLPIVGAFEATEPVWSPPPMSGFGRAPFALLGRAA